MFTILDDPKEVMKGRQKELNSLKEMGAKTDAKRTKAAGKRVIQTRWVDREQDGCVKSRIVLKEINHDHGRMQTEMFASTPSTLSLKTMLATSSHDHNHHSEEDYIAIAPDVHTAFLHADIDQDLYAEPSEESELNEDKVWKLHSALCAYRRAPRLWHQHVVTILESRNFHSHEACREIPERRSECKVPDRNRYTPKVRERVHRQRLGKSTNDTQKHKGRSCATVKWNSHRMVTNTANSEPELR